MTLRALHPIEREDAVGGVAELVEADASGRAARASALHRGDHLGARVGGDPVLAREHSSKGADEGVGGVVRVRTEVGRTLREAGLVVCGEERLGARQLVGRHADGAREAALAGGAGVLDVRGVLDAVTADEGLGVSGTSLVQARG